MFARDFYTFPEVIWTQEFTEALKIKKQKIKKSNREKKQCKPDGLTLIARFQNFYEYSMKKICF